MTRTHIAVMAALAVVFVPTVVHAQQTTIYDSNTGRNIGRATTGTDGNTTIYGADGKVQGRTSTAGSNGTVTIFGADGRRLGTVTTPPKKSQ